MITVSVVLQCAHRYLSLEGAAQGSQLVLDTHEDLDVSKVAPEQPATPVEADTEHEEMSPCGHRDESVELLGLECAKLVDSHSKVT